MFENLKGARLGIFVFLGTILIILGIFLIGSKEQLFQDTFTVKSYFRDVEGLRTGSIVRLNGINIGSVKDISILNDSLGTVQVSMRLNNNIKQFIRLDSKCSIETEGLVGNKIVIISPGTNNYQLIGNGGTVKSIKKIGFAEIFQETQETMKNINHITAEFAEIVKKVNQGKGTIGKLINDDALYNSATALTATADKNLNQITGKLNQVSDVVVDLGSGVKDIIKNVNKSIDNVNLMIDNVKHGEGVLGALIADRSAYDSIKTVITNLVKTTNNTKVAAFKFAENMEALKHNWLFKGYFEERGYWDRDDYEADLKKKLDELKERNIELDKKLNELKLLQKDLEKKQKER